MARNKRKVIQSGIEQQDAYYRDKNNQIQDEIDRKKNDPYKPNLLKRFGAILLDGLMIFGTIALLYLFSYYTIFPKLGYQQTLDAIHERYVESGLYIVDDDGGIISISDKYDENKSPKANYDSYITYYYQNDERAIEANKWNLYCSSKLSSNLFEEVDDQIVEKEGVSRANLKSFYATEYTKAVSFQEKDPFIIRGSNTTLLIVVVSMCVFSFISTGIFYLAIPMLTKHKVSLGQLICKFSLDNMNDNIVVARKKVAVRWFMIYVIDYLLCISIYIVYSSLIGLPLFVTAAMIAFSKNNTGLHDFFSQSRIRNAIPIDQAAMLEALKQNMK